MKKQLLSVLVLIVLLSTVKLFSNENNSKIEIKTSSICEHCKETIEKALSKVDGVTKSDLEIKTKIVTVEYDKTKTNPEEIREAISKAGYDADDVKKNSRAFKRLPKCCQHE